MAGPLKPDKWYEDQGVKPPERTIFEGSNQPLRPDNHKHEWVWPKVGGPFIECRRGHHIHGIPFNHLKERLVGTDEHGRPVFKDIVLSAKVPILKGQAPPEALTWADNKKD